MALDDLMAKHGVLDGIVRRAEKARARRTQRVYVIELTDDAGRRIDSLLPNVYVGETSLSPSQRFQKHLDGGRTSAGKVRQYGVRLRRDLIGARKKVSIDPVTPNDLHRTFGTWCYRGGIQPARIALLLGHLDASMVERVYGVMDAESLAGDVAGVFNKMDLPAVEVPKASSCPPR